MAHIVSTEFNQQRILWGTSPKQQHLQTRSDSGLPLQGSNPANHRLIKPHTLALLLLPQLVLKETCACRSGLLLLHPSAIHTKSFHPLGNSHVAGLHQKRQSDRELPRLLIAFLLCLACYFLWPFHNTFGTSQFYCQSVCLSL